MAMRLRRRGIVAVLLVATGLVGCVQAGAPPSAERGSDREHQQAREALARWAAAVEARGGEQDFVPIGELTGQIGDWEAEEGNNNKPALYAGMVVAAVALPTEAPGEALVRWDDGRTKTVQPISAEQALRELRAAGNQSCPECVPLEVTAAHLSDATFQTSRGPATAPAWEFTLKGTKVVATRIAVAADDGIVVSPPPWDPNDSPAGMRIESATGTVGGRQLTVAFIGAPDGADKPCGADYSAEAVESDTAVVIIVIPHPNGAKVACRLPGAERTAIAELAQPLGERAVLEVTQGLPVPVVLGP
jgi:hypothetical protein